MFRYQVGFGKQKISAWKNGLTTMGWADSAQPITGVREDLYARAFVIQDGFEAPVVIVSLDLWAVTDILRLSILEMVSNTPDLSDLISTRILLSATHTHSGPSGICDTLLYGAQSSGPSAEIISAIVSGVISTMVEAKRSRRWSKLCWGEWQLPSQLLRNRSLNAWRRNLDVSDIQEDASDPGVDQRVRVLRVEDSSGYESGIISWAACHATTVTSQNSQIDSDFSGRAATLVENSRKGTASPSPSHPYVVMLIQGAAGDVTANDFGWADKPSDVPIERVIKRAQEVAEIFAATIETAANRARFSAPIRGSIHAHGEEIDLRSIRVDSEFSGGEINPKLSKAGLGLKFLAGTPEGPGPFSSLKTVFECWQRMKGLFSAESKTTVVDLSRGLEGRAAGLIPLKFLGHLIQHQSFKWWRGQSLDRKTQTETMVKAKYFAQILQIGDSLIAALPGEPSFQSGRRIEGDLLELYRAHGIKRAILTGYSNGYSGYITTREEYGEQNYEGAHTLFGKHTLAAWQTSLIGIGNRLFQTKKAEKFKQAA